MKEDPVGKDVVTVGVIGFGTVGTGTVRVLLENAHLLARRVGVPVKLKYVADTDTSRDRGISLPPGILIPEGAAVADDPEVDIVVELVGGTTVARDLMLRAVRNGKHVVTANKALLAEGGNEIFAEAAANGVQVGFEAAVAGGIPIIKVIREGLVANHILSVYGIINGTANFILTQMLDEGWEFREALGEARRLGYAEADPSFDVEGVDTAHKLAILGTLAYGIPLSFDRIYTEGITGLGAMDIRYAEELGFKVKLLAIAKLAGEEVEMRVHPTMVPHDSLISKVDGVFNAVYVKGDAVGDTLYYGRGAGDMPTASAVVADIAGIARDVAGGIVRPAMDLAESPLTVRRIEAVESMYYFRFTVRDRPGVLSRISGILGDNDISIGSVIQKGRQEEESVPLVMLTHKAVERDIRRALAEIDRLPVVTDATRFIRVEGEG